MNLLKAYWKRVDAEILNKSNMTLGLGVGLAQFIDTSKGIMSPALQYSPEVFAKAVFLGVVIWPVAVLLSAVPKGPR